MGLFDRFRKNKKEPQKQEKTIRVGNNLKNDGKTKHVQNTKSYNVKFNKKNEKPSREDFEKEVSELKKDVNKIDLGLGEKVNESFRTNLNQKLDDTIIKNYGTDEEKAEMLKRQEKENKQSELKKQNKEKYDKKLKKAKELIGLSAYDEAKPLFDELLQTDNYYYIYHTYLELYMYYIKENDFDNAINVLEKHIEVAENFGEDSSFFKSEILDVHNTKLKYKIKQIRQNAVNLYYCGQYNEAKTLFTECVDLGCDDGQTYNLLTNIHIRNRDFESAKKNIRKRS